MTSVEAQVYGPDELLAGEADFVLQSGGSGAPAVRADHCGNCRRRCRDALVRNRGVLGESLQVDRGATEQKLQMEGGRAAATDTLESVQVLQLGDDAFGVR